LYGCGLFIPSACWLWLITSLCSANQSYQLNSWLNLRTNILHSDGKRMYPFPCNEILHWHWQWRLVIWHVWPLDGHFRSVFVLTWCCLKQSAPSRVTNCVCRCQFIWNLLWLCRMVWKRVSFVRNENLLSVVWRKEFGEEMRWRWCLQLTVKKWWDKSGVTGSITVCGTCRFVHVTQVLFRRVPKVTEWLLLALPCLSVRLSVQMEKLGSHWANFHKMLYWGLSSFFFQKI